MSSQDFISEHIDLKFDSFLNWSHHHNHFTALFPGPPGWAGTRKELLDFMVQGEINKGRHTDHTAGRHSIRTNHCPPPPSSHIFYGSDAIPAAQPTVSKHWRHFWTGASGGELLISELTSNPSDKQQYKVRSFVHIVVYGDLPSICYRAKS